MPIPLRFRPSLLRRPHLAVAAAMLALGAPVAHGQSVDDIVRGFGAPRTSGPLTRGISPASRPSPEPALPNQALPPPSPERAAPVDRPCCSQDFQNMTFAFGSATLDTQGRDMARTLGLALARPELAGSRFLIIGHTDAVGSDEMNVLLSRRRAEAVRNFLVQEMSISSSRLFTDGRGRYELKRPEAPTDGINRRVEVRRLDG